MMATGYVHPVAEGTVTTLRDFALRCSFAMMPLISKRDDANQTEPPRELSPSDLSHYEERLAEAQARLDALSSMTEAEREAMLDAEYQQALDEAKRYDAESETELARCKAMRKQVAEWQGAPDGLKKFMLEQLDLSIDGEGTYKAAYHVRRKTFEEAWTRAVENVGRAHADIEREKALTKSRNVWLAQLWSSIDALGDTK